MRRARERLVSAARGLSADAPRARVRRSGGESRGRGRHRRSFRLVARPSPSSPPSAREHPPRAPSPETYPHDVPIEPCTPEDAATMLRQIRKRRAYPVGYFSSRCRHGFPQAYLHAPMHVPARHANVLDENPPEHDTRASDDDETPHVSSRGRSKRARARRRASSPTRGVVAEHALGWLACPLLVRAVDALEKYGAIDAVADVTRAIHISRRHSNGHTPPRRIPAVGSFPTGGDARSRIARRSAESRTREPNSPPSTTTRKTNRRDRVDGSRSRRACCSRRASRGIPSRRYRGMAWEPREVSARAPRRSTGARRRREPRGRDNTSACATRGHARRVRTSVGASVRERTTRDSRDSRDRLR